MKQEPPALIAFRPDSETAALLDRAVDEGLYPSKSGAIKVCVRTLMPGLLSGGMNVSMRRPKLHGKQAIEASR